MTEIIVITLYTVCISLILLMTLGRGYLILSYLNYSKNKINTQTPELTEYPFVTIQLPIYNELYVVDRLIRFCTRMDYPKDRFEIQLLDDSTDETKALVARLVSEKSEQGHLIYHITRDKNIGYKAGALAEGMKSAKGEFIAIFDSDFLPGKDFLKKTIVEFTEDKIGMVQTGWDHLNLDYSLLTKSQAFGLDAHFTIEQTGRNKAGLLINFNGTAGIWRKTCIEDAGGWEHDTLTEDLDLSYRAQLKGWVFKFIEDIRTPAELPVEMGAIKSQQFRWTKGSVETAKKILPEFIQSALPFKQKLFGLLHLLNPFIFVLMFVTGVLSIPLLYIKNQNQQFDTYFNFASIFILGFLIMILFHWITSRSILHRKLTFWEFFKLFPTFCSISLGLSYHNTKAVLEGVIGKKSPFIRTPKFNVRKLKDQFLNNKYLNNRLSPSTFTEILLSVYFLSGIFLAFYYNDYGLLPFHLMLFAGFSLISGYSIAHARAK